MNISIENLKKFELIEYVFESLNNPRDKELFYKKEEPFLEIEERSLCGLHKPGKDPSNDQIQDWHGKAVEE